MKNEDLRWNLDDLVRAKDFEKVFGQAIKEILLLQKEFRKLSPSVSADIFRKAVGRLEKVKDFSSKIMDFSMLYFTTHLTEDRAFGFKSKADEIDIMFTETYLELSRWLQGLPVSGMKTLDKKNQARLMKSIPKLHFMFEKLLEGKKHTLSIEEERMTTRKDTNLKSSILGLYQLIVNDYQYEFKSGKKKPIILKTSAEVSPYVHSSDPSDREGAYKAIFGPYEKDLLKHFNIYQAISKDWDENARLRGYPSPISFRNFRNDIEDKTIETVMSVCTENRHLFQEYFRIKAKALKMKKLRRYDIYAPVGGKEHRYTFKESKTKVLNIFKEFNAGFYDRARLIFDENHVDSHPRQGKRSGAFCATTAPSLTPYVLLNFNGTPTSLMTMAHELGHGIHSLYSNKLSTLVQSEPLPLAETASTFSEMLIFERLLQELKNPEEKKTLLFEKLGSSYATIIRQNYFVKFEMVAHEEIRKGITAKDLCELYMLNLKEQFGNSLDISGEFRFEWTYIPHIFRTPFYCYAYNFGELLAMSLYSIYRERGKGFIPKIEMILSSGGSERPSKLLKEVGIDINSKNFWNGSFSMIREWLKML
ncbi:MAG TPA: oligoendopeptidase F [Firmicutes bacterium]|nr:oligoendopeptidase F [Bacillota bacterium]